MISEKFGAIERYNIEIARQVAEIDLRPIFIYNQMPSNESYLNSLRSYGAEIIELRIDEGYFTMCRKINRLLSEYKPQIVHTNFHFPQVRAVIFLAWLWRVPLRFCTIGSMPGNNPKLISKIWYNLLASTATKILTVSDAIRLTLACKFKVNTKKIETLRMGIDFSAFEENSLTKQEIEEKYNLPNDKILIGCVAFHQPIKGVDILLDAISVLKYEHKQTDFVLCQVGGWAGGISQELQRKAKDLKIDDIVVWLGLQDNVPEIMHVFDIYCQPSRSEGLPNTILEAFMAKLPVVASNVGGIPEVVKDGKNGFLVEVENSEQMAEKLNVFLNDKKLGVNFGKQGQQFVIDNYNVKSQVKTLISNYYGKYNTCFDSNVGDLTKV